MEGILKKFRAHGYQKMVPALSPQRATFKSVHQDDPAAQRTYDYDGAGARIELKPKPESIQYWEPGWQDIIVYRSEDGKYEVSIEFVEGETAPNEIKVDISWRL